MSQQGILLVDDDSGYRSLARELLATWGFHVLGEAADGDGALSAAEQLRPGVVLLDVRLPDIDGFEVTRRLLAGPNPPLVVLISTREAVDYGRSVVECGAAGFIAKASLSENRLRAILPACAEASK